MQLLKCLVCDKKMKEITNTHLKQHSLSQKEYKIKFPTSLVRSLENNIRRSLVSKDKTYEERYGEEKGKSLRDLRSKSALKQMEDIGQRVLRARTSGKFKDPEKRRENIKKSITKEVVRQRKETNLERYGVVNPGIFTAGSSKESRVYIQSFLKENGYSEDQCYYSGGGITGNEYYQKIYNSSTGQFEFVRYDLVVFNKEKSQIQLVLEFNGPWHSTLDEMLRDPDSTLPPWSKRTRREVYEHDLFKLEHISKLCSKVFIYWRKDKRLVEFKNSEIK